MNWDPLKKPDCPALDKPEDMEINDIAWAEILSERGFLDEAIKLMEKHPEISDSAFWGRLNRMRMLRAARDGDWELGIGLWEAHCERLVKTGILSEEVNTAGYARFFLALAESKLAAGERVEALRLARKARRLSGAVELLATPELQELLLDPKPAPAG